MESHFEVVSMMGEGKFAKVKKVKSSATNDIFAAKISNNDTKSFLTTESDIHSRLTHPNIVQFVSSFETNNCDDTKLFRVSEGKCGVIIMELCEEKTLEQKWRKFEISESELKNYAYEIASGLLYLKEQGIVHRDIKPANILFKDGHCKIADFGFAVFIEGEKVKENTVRGSPNFMGPETFSGIYGSFTDVWAFGVVLYEIVYRTAPFGGADMDTFVREVRTIRPYFSKRKMMTPDLQNLIESCLTKDSTKRIKPEEILKHPYLSERSPSSVPKALKSSPNEHPLRSVEWFKAKKAEFGEGDRVSFYLYLANIYPDDRPMPMSEFIKMWEKL